MLLLWLSGLLLLRFAVRKLFQLLFQLPPRSTFIADPHSPQQKELHIKLYQLFPDFAFPTAQQPANFIYTFRSKFILVYADTFQIKTQAQIKTDLVQ